MPEEMSPETYREIRLDRIERALVDMKSEADQFRDEVRGRLDAVDRRQEKILWAVIGVIITVAGAVLGAAVMGILPHS